MSAFTPFVSTRLTARLIAAGLAVAIGIGLLAGLATLFQRAGTPLQHVVIAERACSGYRFVSEREDCQRSYVSASRAERVASR